MKELKVYIENLMCLLSIGMNCGVVGVVNHSTLGSLVT